MERNEEEPKMPVLSNRLKFIKANSLQDFDRLKLGHLEIDNILNGGFKTQVLNEIVGCSSSGKTQICLILSLMVQLKRELGGLNKVAVYICTEDVFPIRRLHELGYWFQEKYGIKNFLDNVFISHVSDYDKLRFLLFAHLPHLSVIKNIGLIVIDSIAGLFRSDNVDVSYEKRGKQLIELAIRLRYLGSKLNCAIICTNQVADNIYTGTTESCLGLSWSNLINYRFTLDRKYSSPNRIFQVTFAPDLPTLKSKFYISQKGIR